MFEPECERDRLFQQHPSVLVFAAAVETAQHQEKIDDIGIGAGPACLQLDLIDLELAQLCALAKFPMECLWFFFEVI